MFLLFCGGASQRRCHAATHFLALVVDVLGLGSDRDKGWLKKMSLAQNLKLSLPKNRMSEEAVLLTVCSTHVYYKLRKGQPGLENA